MDNNFDEPLKEQGPSQPQKEDKTTWYFFLFLLFIWAGNYIYNLFISKEKRKRTRTPDKMQKDDVCKMYVVNKHTLGKWVKYFCHPSVLSYETYKKRRRLTSGEYLHLLVCLGVRTDETPVMSKGEIADSADSHTDTLRTWVIQNIDKLDFSIEAYNALNVFPPAIAHQISEIFNRTIV